MKTNVDKMIEMATWGANNFAHNLDFIPDDKLNWKPEPTANSALEVANHMIRSFDWAMSTIKGDKPETREAKTKKEAQELLKKLGAEFCEMLQKMSEKELAEKKPMPWGEVTHEFLADLAVIDVIHHRGQVVYIQTLLGDTVDHFEM